ncbi:MAG: MarR family winged helix-turn-helix transcriptional regulator [Acutalibacteraceae bacterium]
MDYDALAEELLRLRIGAQQTPTNRAINKLAGGEMFVMNFLFLNNRTAYPKDLSKNMEVSTARIATILNSLEKRGLITRTIDKSDNRQVIVCLTEAGFKTIKKKRLDMRKKLADTLERLGPHDASEFIRIQKKLFECLKQA